MHIVDSAARHVFGYLASGGDRVPQARGGVRSGWSEEKDLHHRRRDILTKADGNYFFLNKKKELKY